MIEVQKIMVCIMCNTSKLMYVYASLTTRQITNLDNIYWMVISYCKYNRSKTCFCDNFPPKADIGFEKVYIIHQVVQIHDRATVILLVTIQRCCVFTTYSPRLSLYLYKGQLVINSGSANHMPITQTRPLKSRHKFIFDDYQKVKF